VASAMLVHAPAIIFNVGAPKPNSDFYTHYRWAIQFYESLRAGDPYPHWMWRQGHGLGQPALLFYSPLFFYVSGAVRLITSNTWAAMRIVFVLSTIITGFYGWRLFRLFADNLYALAGAVLLQGAPMILWLFYYENDFPWAVGFAALVALTYCVLRPRAFEGWIDLPASLAIAALVLTHILSAFMALLCFSCGLMYLCFVRRSQRGACKLLSWFVSTGFAFALAAFYLVPALGSIHLISPAYLTTVPLYRGSFAFPTITGVDWFTYQWIVPALVFLGVVAATWHAHQRKDLSDCLGGALLLMLVISWTSLFMASELSYPLWLIDNTPLRAVQWPIRFIYITSATGLVANLLALRDLQWTRLAWLHKVFVVVPLALILPATGLLSAKMILVEGKPLDLSVDEAIPYNGLGEYRLASEGEHGEEYYRAGGLVAECAQLQLLCREIERNSRSQIWEVSGERPAHLRLPLRAFPAWQLAIDDTSVPYTADPGSGLISVELPAGMHRVTASWNRLGVERAGLGITSFAVLLLAILVWRQGFSNPARRQRRSWDSRRARQELRGARRASERTAGISGRPLSTLEVHFRAASQKSGIPS
jgi:hypothetical protein